MRAIGGLVFHSGRAVFSNEDTWEKFSTVKKKSSDSFKTAVLGDSTMDLIESLSVYNCDFHSQTNPT